MALEFKIKQKSEKTTNKILFSCHEDDFNMYFNDITNDILSLLDCSIYYLDNNSNQINDIEDYETQLSQFNLFVFPITSKFLTNNSRAKDVDFKYAFYNKYPILPILVELNLFNKFNEFAPIQALTRDQIESNKEVYINKLRSYLNSVLIEKETIERVKQAFDAYIFLSYRKKDRKQAKELMSFIHKNKFMRDIAIWYDEFLTPGENFNNEIAENLLKSKLVTLAITPNINEKYGEKGNYVMDEEYPLAVKENKQILPIEVIKTNKDILKKNFPNISDPVSISEEKELSKYFMNLFKEAINVRNDDDPEHLFFIGLAYLNGIDVERDTATALELLENASKKNYLPAFEELSNYYKNNEYKYIVSNKWLEKAFDICFKSYGFNNDTTKHYYNKLKHELFETRCNSYYISFMSNLAYEFINNGDYDSALECVNDIKSTSEWLNFGYEQRIFEILMYMYEKLIDTNDNRLKTKVLNELISASIEIEESSIVDTLNKEKERTLNDNENNNIFRTVIQLCKHLANENDSLIFKEIENYDEINELLQFIQSEIDQNASQNIVFYSDIDRNMKVSDLKNTISDNLTLAIDKIYKNKRFEFAEYCYILNKHFYKEDANYYVLTDYLYSQENDTFVEVATYEFINDYSNDANLPAIYDEIKCYFDMNFYPIDFDTYIRDYLLEYFDLSYIFSLKQ